MARGLVCARAGARGAGGERGAAGPGCSAGFPWVPCVRAQVPAEQAESEVLLALAAARVFLRVPCARAQVPA